MNVLYRSQLPPPAGHPHPAPPPDYWQWTFVDHFNLGMRKQLVHLSNTRPNTKNPSRLESPGIAVQRKFQQHGSSVQGAGAVSLPGCNADAS